MQVDAAKRLTHVWRGHDKLGQRRDRLLSDTQAVPHVSASQIRFRPLLTAVIARLVMIMRVEQNGEDGTLVG